ncbi:putative variant ionotropic glutamate receptor-like 17, partial [Homarus americanus]
PGGDGGGARDAVVVVGPRSRAHALAHPKLHDTLHAFYLTTHDPSTPPDTSCSPGECEGEVEVYRRCLYCRGGQPGVTLLDRWHPLAGFVNNRSLIP